MELFKTDRAAPLAWRMRPRDLDEFIGQSHLLDKGRPLREAIEGDMLVSLILYGPPGSGKTALAKIIAKRTRAMFITLNAVTSGIGDIKDAINKAHSVDRTILFIDEIHRFNKLQQDALLPDVENGTVTLIGVSTQNPFFSIIPALSSRSMIFQFLPLSEDEIVTIIERALADTERGLGDMHIEMDNATKRYIARLSEGDARRALNTLEMGALILRQRGAYKFDIDLASEVLQRKSIYYSEDEHYNIISAFIKSMRGSDPDATVYWLARMIEGGEDPLFIARRIVICAAEDVGNADPKALEIAVAAYHAVESIGMPEGRIPLAQAALYIATAPKSNSSYMAIERALQDVRDERLEDVPEHLKSTGYSGAERLGAGGGYKYPHDYPDHYVEQAYMKRHRIFYEPSEQGFEQIIKKRLRKRRSRG